MCISVAKWRQKMLQQCWIYRFVPYRPLSLRFVPLMTPFLMIEQGPSVYKSDQPSTDHIDQSGSSVHCLIQRFLKSMYSVWLRFTLDDHGMTFVINAKVLCDFVWLFLSGQINSLIHFNTDDAFSTRAVCWTLSSQQTWFYLLPFHQNWTKLIYHVNEL